MLNLSADAANKFSHINFHSANNNNNNNQQHYEGGLRASGKRGECRWNSDRRGRLMPGYRWAIKFLLLIRCAWASCNNSQLHLYTHIGIIFIYIYIHVYIICSCWAPVKVYV